METEIPRRTNKDSTRLIASGRIRTRCSIRRHPVNWRNGAMGNLNACFRNQGPDAHLEQAGPSCCWWSLLWLAVRSSTVMLLPIVPAGATTSRKQMTAGNTSSTTIWQTTGGDDRLKFERCAPDVHAVKRAFRRYRQWGTDGEPGVGVEFNFVAYWRCSTKWRWLSRRSPLHGIG